jgi:hypothetical protein
MPDEKSLTQWMNRMNPFVRLILRSPLHPLMSKNVMLVSFCGRKSGREYHVPTNFHREGDELLVTSFRERTWWRNLRGGAAVTLLLQGKELAGRADVIENPAEVAVALSRLVVAEPAYARFLHIGPEADGTPSAADALRAAQTRVIVRVELR